MKRRFIIIGMMCMIAGAACLVGGFAASGWNVSALDPVPAEYKVYDAQSLPEGQSIEDLKTVSLTAQGRVKVTRGQDFRVDYATCDYFDYDISFADGNFSIVYREKKNYAVHFDLFGVGQKKFAVTITLPETAEIDLTAETDNSSVYVDGGRYGQLKVKTDNGGVHICDLIADTVSVESGNAGMDVRNVEAASITATTTNGSLHSDDCKAEKAVFATKNASLYLSGGKFGTVEATTTNSGITVESVEVEGLLKLGSTNGRVQLENATAGSVEAKTNNSSVRLYDVFATSILASSTNGSIRVEGISATDITMTTTNASIKGTIRGKLSDYTVTSATDGSNNLPSGGHGEGKLIVTTSNGSIRIDFLGA